MREGQRRIRGTGKQAITPEQIRRQLIFNLQGFGVSKIEGIPLDEIDYPTLRQRAAIEQIRAEDRQEA